MGFNIGIGSVFSLIYKLWKDGVFMKISNFLNRNVQQNQYYSGLLDQQQKEAYSLAAKLQSHFSIKYGDTFLTWEQWFELTKSFKYFIADNSWLDSGIISYMRSNLCVSEVGRKRSDHLALRDATVHLMTDFSENGQQVSNSQLELLLRNYMCILDRMPLSAYGIQKAKNALRPLQMIMLTGK